MGTPVLTAQFTFFDYLNIIILLPAIMIGSFGLAGIRWFSGYALPRRVSTAIFVGVGLFFLRYVVAFGIVRYYGAFSLPKDNGVVQFAIGDLAIALASAPLLCAMLWGWVELLTRRDLARTPHSGPALAPEVQKEIEALRQRMAALNNAVERQGHGDD